MNRRSEKGQGQKVKIIVAGPVNGFSDDLIGGFGHSAICTTQGVDFSETIWPVVVKASLHITSEQLAQHLADIAASLINGAPFEISAKSMVEPVSDDLASNVVSLSDHRKSGAEH